MNPCLNKQYFLKYRYEVLFIDTHILHALKKLINSLIFLIYFQYTSLKNQKKKVADRGKNGVTTTL